MTTPPAPPPGDDELIGWLGRVSARADPVPAALLDAARAAFGLRELDIRVAELVRDSAIDTAATIVRGDGPRLLSFEAGDIAIECEIRMRQRQRDLIGQLVGGTATSVSAHFAARTGSQDQQATAPVDAQGRFRIPDLPAGVLRLRCLLADSTTVVTSWTVI